MQLVLVLCWIVTIVVSLQGSMVLLKKTDLL